MLTFPRNGLSLANAELMIVFAKLFRGLDMTLWDTTPHDMEWGDYTVAVFNGHLKATIKERGIS